MKYCLSVLMLLIFFHSIGQEDLPVIHASEDRVYFLEGKQTDQRNWWLDPSVKPDIYRTDKISKPTWFSVHTDTESLRVKLKPGETYDFIILRGQDSCYTQIAVPERIMTYETLSPSTHDTIPFTVTSGNNIKLTTILNGQDTLDLYFDSGATDIVLSHEAVAQKTHLLERESSDYTPIDYAPLSGTSTLQIGKNTWEGIPVHPTQFVAQETSGHFGWNLFDGRVVEIDYDNGYFIVHSKLPKKPKGYTQLKIEYINTLFCVRGKTIAQGKPYANRCLFDTGYQRAVLLDSVLMAEENFPKNDLTVLKTTSLRNGTGEVFHTKIVLLDEFAFKKATAEKVPAQLLNKANPARFKTHILGNELLMRFNTILDFQQNIVYLKPNSLMDRPYSDAS